MVHAILESGDGGMMQATERRKVIDTKGLGTLTLSLMLIACTPTEVKPEVNAGSRAEAATTLTFDAEAPPLWFDNPVCNSRYAHAETLDVRLPEGVDIDVERLHGLRELSTRTLMWAPAAGRYLVGAPAAGSRSRVSWRLEPGAPVELWVIDASPSAEHSEACWDAITIRGTVAVESNDGSLAILGPALFLQLTSTSTQVLITGTAEDFGLGFSSNTQELDPSIELHVDLPVAKPRNSVPVRRDARGLTPIEVRLTVTVDKLVMLGGVEPQQVRGVEFLAVSEESKEARELLGEATP
jgi:hypothetical protein